MDKTKHLKEFTIGNYRRFVDFKVENIGQFNLIVGDNNTGKTSLLEALTYYDQDIPGKIINTLTLLAFRNNSIIDEYNDNNHAVYQNFHFLKSNENPLAFNFISETENNSFTFDKYDSDKYFKSLNAESKAKIRYNSTYEKDSFILTSNAVTSIGKFINFNEFGNFIPFIPFGLGYKKEIPEYYSDIQKNREERKSFINNVKCFIPKIENIIIDSNIGILIEEKDNLVASPLFSYGDGANKFFRILLELNLSKNKQLMIDEIDTGIHHSRFLEFWKVILQVAKNYNVQLFATTHNEECIHYYRKALEELEKENHQNKTLFSNEARLISLREIDDEVKAFTYGLEDIQYANEVGRELRGGL